MRRLAAKLAQGLGYEVIPDEKRPGIAWIEPHPCGGTFKNYNDLPDLSTGNGMVWLDGEMRSRGWVLWVSTHIFEDNLDGKVVCEYFKPEEFDTTSGKDMARADTLPLAVALAAHKALFGEEWSE